MVLGFELGTGNIQWLRNVGTETTCSAKSVAIENA